MINRLEKKLSPLNVWSLALGSIIGWGAFVMPSDTFLIKAGPLGTAIGMFVAAIVMIVIAFNYNYMISKYPVAGGEFTYAQKAFGQKHGFWCAWFLGLSYITIVPLNATALALLGRSLLNNVFQTGFHYNIAGYEVYLGEVILAVFSLLLFAFLSIKGVKIAGVFQTALVFVLLLGIMVIFFTALLENNVTASNLQPLFYNEQNVLGGILSVVAVSPWAFVGFDTIPQAAEEFSFSYTKTKIIMILSIVFGASVYIVLNTITALVIPPEYSTWVDYINDLKNLKGIVSLPTFNAAYLLLGDIGLVFLGMSVLAAILSGIVGFYMASSRLLYSLAKEKYLPSWFGVLHNYYNTPRNSIIFVMCVSSVAPLFGRNALSWIVEMSSVGAAVGYGYTSAAALSCAIRKKNRFITITGIIGIIMSIVFVSLLLIPIDTFNCSLSKQSYSCLVFWIVIGFVFYKITEFDRAK